MSSPCSSVCSSDRPSIGTRPSLPRRRPAAPRLALLAAAVAVGLAACATAPQGTAPAPAATPAAADSTAAAPGASAAPAKPTAAPDPEVLGLWKIEQARGAPLLHKLNARLDFRPDGRMVANGGCNGISAPYTLEAHHLTLGRLDVTRKTCNEALMEQEDRVLTALERAVTARVPPHKLLELLDADGAVLLRGSRLPAAE